jgi:hypothetical protein
MRLRTCYDEDVFTRSYWGHSVCPTRECQLHQGQINSHGDMERVVMIFSPRLSTRRLRHRRRSPLCVRHASAMSSLQKNAPKDLDKTDTFMLSTVFSNVKPKATWTRRSMIQAHRHRLRLLLRYQYPQPKLRANRRGRSPSFPASSLIPVMLISVLQFSAPQIAVTLLWGYSDSVLSPQTVMVLGISSRKMAFQCGFSPLYVLRKLVHIIWSSCASSKHLQTRRFLDTLQGYLYDIQRILIQLHKAANARPAPFVDHLGILRDSKTGRPINGVAYDDSEEVSSEGAGEVPMREYFFCQHAFLE